MALSKADSEAGLAGFGPREIDDSHALLFATRLAIFGNQATALLHRVICVLVLLLSSLHRKRRSACRTILGVMLVSCLPE